MDEAVDLIAAANTIAASDLGLWAYELNVAGIRNAEDYWRCLGYLQELSVVNHVTVDSAAPGNVTFMLELSALPQYLEKTLQGGRFLGFDDDQSSFFLLQ